MMSCFGFPVDLFTLLFYFIVFIQEFLLTCLIAIIGLISFIYSFILDISIAPF